MNSKHLLGLLFPSTVVAAIVLTGCAAGPEFQKPAPPEGAGYSAAPLTTMIATEKVAGGEAQRFIEGLDIPGQWWTLFRSKPLNDLIERSLKANPDIKAAQAALVVARENVLSQRGAYFPGVSGSITASRQKSASELSPTPNSGELYFGLVTPQVNVSYAPDVFGLNRRTVESLKAQEENVRFQLAATHIALSANIVTAAIQEASLRGQIDAAHELITINTDMVDILRKQFDKGYASRLDLAAQESQLAQVTATLPPLLKQLAQVRNLLAALSGGYPNAELTEKFELANLQLPQELPVSIPSQLVEQRPDVRQAEENLHAASAQIGIAVANRLPNFTLTADAGSMALAFSKLFSGGAGVWSLAANVTEPIFQGGTLLHRERAARAAYTEAAEQYRSTVPSAFRNVADVLKALEEDDDALKAASLAKDAAGVTLDMARKQWRSGYVNYLALLSAEQAYQQTLVNFVMAQANRFTDTAALFQALGGGWWNRPDLAKE